MVDKVGKVGLQDPSPCWEERGGVGGGESRDPPNPSPSTGVNTMLGVAPLYMLRLYVLFIWKHGFAFVKVVCPHSRNQNITERCD